MLSIAIARFGLSQATGKQLGLPLVESVTKC